jgi:hypothetical protein
LQIWAIFSESSNALHNAADWVGARRVKLNLQETRAQGRRSWRRQQAEAK